MCAVNNEMVSDVWYNSPMKHWSVDPTTLQKDPDAYTIWRLEQAVNYGLRDGKIKEAELVKYWDRLDIDPQKKKFLSLILPA